MNEHNMDQIVFYWQIKLNQLFPPHILCDLIM